jgi:hypothetical protein
MEASVDTIKKIMVFINKKINNGVYKETRLDAIHNQFTTPTPYMYDDVLLTLEKCISKKKTLEKW